MDLKKPIPLSPSSGLTSGKEQTCVHSGGSRRLNHMTGIAREMEEAVDTDP